MIRGLANTMLLYVYYYIKCTNSVLQSSSMGVFYFIKFINKLRQAFFLAWAHCHVLCSVFCVKAFTPFSLKSEVSDARELQ